MYEQLKQYVGTFDVGKVYKTNPFMKIVAFHILFKAYG